MQTWGSEGDIRPFVALADALTRRGHQVELLYTEIGNRSYDDVAASLGFTARAVASPVVADEQELFAIGLKAINTSNQLQQGLWISRRLLEPVIPQIYEAGLELAKRCDIFVHHFIVHASRAAADKAGVPFVTVAFAHMLLESRHIHPTGFPRLGDWMNAFGWKIARLALNRTLLTDVNRFRARVDLPPFEDLMNDAWASHLLHLVASSPALIDRPPDWPAWNQLSGFLSLPAHEREVMSPDVTEFLSRGPAPIFMGFGSLMPTSGQHLADTVSLFRDAASRAGQRAIIQSEIESPSTDEVLFIKRTPHVLVFPRCAAVVHHAGAGTTHTALKTGSRSITVPHVSDQFAWSDDLYRLGVGTLPLKRTRLTAKALAARIREAVGNEHMKQSAIAIQQRMAADDGPATAARLIEKAAGHGN